MNSLKKVLLIIVFFPIVSAGQMRISQLTQESSITNNKESKLFFIDFWATWCGPCITVSKYLSSVQEQFPNDFYILSLSQENPEVINKYLSKHKTDLAVAIDYEGEAFIKYNVSSLPYGVLLNADGEKLWEGHPAELGKRQIDAFLKTQSKTVSVGSMFKLISYERENKKSKIDDELAEDITLKKTAFNSFDELQIEKNKRYLKLTGTLKSILAYANAVSENQIELSPNIINETYKITFKYGSSAYANIKETLYEILSLSEHYKEIEGEAIVLDVANAKLWDEAQINWGSDTPNFLISDFDIKADNVSLNDIKYKLSVLLKTPILLENNKYFDENLLHDWDIHYKYFDLMVTNFIDNYGINIEKKEVSYPKYIIIKKTP